MRLIILFLIVTLSSTSAAQICSATSKEMERFQLQKTWTTKTLSTDSGSAAVTGYVDHENNFYFDDLSQKTTAKAQLTIDPNNKGNEEFFFFCNPEKGHMLRGLRRSKDKNKYTLKVQYVPSLAGFKNQPLVTQRYKETTARLDLRLQEKSILLKPDVLDPYFKTDVVEQLNQQLANQREFGVLHLDLTGLDDLVCDLALGNATLGIFRSGYSERPLVEQKIQVKPSDVHSIYGALKGNLVLGQSKAINLFSAGMQFANLEQNRRIDVSDPNLQFEILRKLMNPDMQELAQQNNDSLSCVADQLQNYKVVSQNHFINVSFVVPGLESLKKSQVGRQ